MKNLPPVMPDKEFVKNAVNYPAHRAGHLKKLDEGDCIPLTPTPHSSPSTGRGILRKDFIKERPFLSAQN